jgi:hypothetical protein
MISRLISSAVRHKISPHSLISKAKFIRPFFLHSVCPLRIHTFLRGSVQNNDWLISSAVRHKISPFHLISQSLIYSPLFFFILSALSAYIFPARVKAELWATHVIRRSIEIPETIILSSPVLLWAVRFSFVQLTSIQLIAPSFLIKTVLISLGKCAHQTLPGVRERHTGFGLMHSKEL